MPYAGGVGSKPQPSFENYPPGHPASESPGRPASAPGADSSRARKRPAQTGPPAPFRLSTVQLGPGVALRGWGLALMLFGFVPILATLLATIGATAEGGLAAVFATYLVIIGLYGIVGALGVVLYRAGLKKRDLARQMEPPK